MPRIISYNINGIRAALRKGLDEWLIVSNPDVLCLQEIKANPEQFNQIRFKNLGYKSYINSAEKPGYSGVAILAKTEPNNIHYGCGIEEIDLEGRIIRIDYDTFSVMSVYFPSGSSGEIRQRFKINFLSQFQEYINVLTQQIPNLIISGDYNICHTEIDIHNPKRNQNTSGFLKEERDWLSQFLDSGFIDSFRWFNKEPHQYSWWSYRANSRIKNLGWRIDYNMISNPLIPKLKGAAILSNIIHSDHCPVLVDVAD